MWEEPTWCARSRRWPLRMWLTISVSMYSAVCATCPHKHVNLGNGDDPIIPNGRILSQRDVASFATTALLRRRKSNPFTGWCQQLVPRTEPRLAYDSHYLWLAAVLAYQAQRDTYLRLRWQSAHELHCLLNKRNCVHQGTEMKENGNASRFRLNPAEQQMSLYINY